MKQPQEVLGVEIVGGLREASTPGAGASFSSKSRTTASIRGLDKGEVVI